MSRFLTFASLLQLAFWLTFGNRCFAIVKPYISCSRPPGKRVLGHLGAPRPLASFVAVLLGSLEATLGPPWGAKTLQTQTAAAVCCFQKESKNFSVIFEQTAREG